MIRTFSFFTSRSLLLYSAALWFPGAAGASLTNYWPVTENAGATTANTAGGATGTLNNGAGFVTDGTRGQVLLFDGTDDWMDGGMLPAFTTSSSFTWSFWANASANNVNSVVAGNRWGPAANVNSTPLNWIKFTPGSFEYNTDAGDQRIDYTDFTAGTWVNHVVVKDGAALVYYRDGMVQNFRNTTAGHTNAPGLYFGADRGTEAWGGRLDDMATWNNALPASSVAKIASGAATPQTAALTSAPMQTVLSDSFTGATLDGSKWTATNRGLENNSPAGYNAPSVSGGTVTLGGTTTQSFWYGSSIESVSSFSSNLETRVGVDRVSLTGSGSASRSSLWLIGDDSHYIHLSDNAGEGNWSFNINDAGGIGTNNAAGAGANMADFDVVPFTNGGTHRMEILWSPTGSAGDANVFLYVDGVLGGVQFVSNFPSTFRVALTGQARAASDSVGAVFDNFSVQQIPEPTVTMLITGMGLGLMLRRRR